MNRKRFISGMLSLRFFGFENFPKSSMSEVDLVDSMLSVDYTTNNQIMNLGQPLRSSPDYSTCLNHEILHFPPFFQHVHRTFCAPEHNFVSSLLLPQNYQTCVNAPFYDPQMDINQHDTEKEEKSSRMTETIFFSFMYS